MRELGKNLQYTDTIDLFCQFADKLELAKDENHNYINNPSFEFMQRRMDFLDEEVNELREGIKQKDLVEILDGAIDTTFIAMTQAYHLFRATGHDHIASVTGVRSSMLMVGMANMLKNKPTGKGEKITKPDNWISPNKRLEWLIKPPRTQNELKQYHEDIGRESA